MFKRLLISCPNHNGGLVLIDDKKVVRLDNLSTTGIFFDDGICIRGFQSNGGLIGVNKNGSQCSNWIQCPDVHDVMVHNQSIYAVETKSNSIAQYDFQGRLIKKRLFSDKTDSWRSTAKPTRTTIVSTSFPANIIAATAFHSTSRNCCCPVRGDTLIMSGNWILCGIPSVRRPLG